MSPSDLPHYDDCRIPGIKSITVESCKARVQALKRKSVRYVQFTGRWTPNRKQITEKHLIGPQWCYGCPHGIPIPQDVIERAMAKKARERILELKKTGTIQRRIAEAAGISYPALTNFLSGRSSKIHNKEKWFKLLEVIGLEPQEG